MALPTDAGATRRVHPVARLFVGMVVLYQRVLSPHLGARCRFVPSCSAYASEALTALPLGTALRHIAGRLLRCGPWSKTGVDLVPTARTDQTTSASHSLCPGLYLR